MSLLWTHGRTECEDSARILFSEFAIAKIESLCGITNAEVERKHAELCKSAWRFRQEALVIWKERFEGF